MLKDLVQGTDSEEDDTEVEYTSTEDKELKDKYSDEEIQSPTNRHSVARRTSSRSATNVRDTSITGKALINVVRVTLIDIHAESDPDFPSDRLTKTREIRIEDGEDESVTEPDSEDEDTFASINEPSKNGVKAITDAMVGAVMEPDVSSGSETEPDDDFDFDDPFVRRKQSCSHVSSLKRPAELESSTGIRKRHRAAV